MKKLDLNKYGVLVMNAEEMRVTDGGQLKEYTPLTGNAILDVAISISNAAKWVYNQFQ